jgi:hypothetical protein
MKPSARRKFPFQVSPFQYSLVVNNNNRLVDNLCKDLPIEFSTFLKYCRDLRFDANPDYV